MSLFGTVVSCCGVLLSLPAAPPDEVVSDGVFDGLVASGEVDVGELCVVSPGTGVCPGVLSGVVAPVCGVVGVGFVLVPPDGVCSLIGWLLGDCACVSVLLLLWADCATVNVALSNAIVAIETSFFMVYLPGYSSGGSC